ncbi:hypothetical protein TRV_05894 [Trichophyton verrucosum HKI 0517]|uniref:Uncharacterized protein n=1 Tax=Trichophyton verrucosum (strain HKI 0517) TaxID=663202 RepID=D4DFE7_TRIVH|nr:uncharacterized protein TRV_05894 [Trichophyton verrucosum HKI 0517]EFE39409.1 hypothetical protein TRV_05894 [Trichophyton verrucosum HKI 0517]
MGFLNWWSNLRDSMHSVKETETRTAHRLAHSPPELWSSRDHIASRRLRFRRELALKKAKKENRSIVPVVMRYPEGPYWPYTIEDDMGEYLKAYKHKRKIDTFRARHPHLQIHQTDENTFHAYNPWNGETFLLY